MCIHTKKYKTTMKPIKWAVFNYLDGVIIVN